MQTVKAMDYRAAAAYIGCSTAALRQWKRLGKGPSYSKVGKLVRYRQNDLDSSSERGLDPQITVEERPRAKQVRLPRIGKQRSPGHDPAPARAGDEESRACSFSFLLLAAHIRHALR
jgi:hypothetical protein